MKAAIAASDPNGIADPILCQLLHAMKETHSSMRAVFTAAGCMEKKEGQSRRWVDMLLLARAQYGALFNGLLVAHDENSWGPRYRKAGWASMACRHFYSLRPFGNTPAGDSTRRTNLKRLKAMARREGVTVREWIATTAEVRGVALRFGATTKDRIEALPTPGAIVNCSDFKSGLYAKLGRLLWQHWKFLCDPAHVEIATLWLRVLIRDVPADCVPRGARDEFIYSHVVAQSLVPSLVAVLTLTAVLALRNRHHGNLMAKLVKAWEPFEKGAFESGIIWDVWAREALGILSA